MSSGDNTEPAKLIVAQDLFQRYCQEVKSGGQEAFEALCEKHPDEASCLRELHSIYKLGSALVTSSSFNESVRRRLGDIDEITLAVEQDISSNATVVTQEEDDTQPSLGDSSRYAMEGQVARGGMGVILRVRDQDLNRSIAMKVMYRPVERRTATETDSLAFARFLEEAQVMAQLDHPGIVPVHEVGFDADGQLYFTMKLVKGKDFNKICELIRANEEGWNISRGLAVLVRVCQALAFAHSKGVIHRDLKPSNIMVGRFGEAYLMDWGLAKIKGRQDLHDIRLQPDHEASQTTIHSYRTATDSDQEFALITLDGSVLGTPAYMPPEQASGNVDDVDERSDVYSLGAVLYKLLTGTAPYLKQGAKLSPHTILGLVVQGPPIAVEKVNPEVPAELVAICKQAMSRERSDRYQSCRDLAEDIQAYLDRRVVRAYRTGALAELRSWVGRNKATAAILSCALILGAVGVIGFMAREKQNAESLSRQLALSALNRGQLLCESGQLGEGLLSMVHALRKAPAGNGDLRELIRSNLASWMPVADPLDLELRAGDVVWHAAFSPDAKLIATAGVRNASVWNARTGELFGQTTDDAENTDWVYFSADGSTLITRGYRNNPVVQTWVLAEGVMKKRGPAIPDVITVSPSRRLVLVRPSSSELQVRSVSNGEVILAIDSDVPVTSRVAFSPDEGVLAGLLDNGAIRIWDAATGAVLATIVESEPFAAIQFSPDGQLLAARAEKFVQCFSVADGRPVGRPMMHEETIRDVAIDPDSRILAISSDDWAVRLWLIESGEALGKLIRHPDDVQGLAFDHSGQRLVTSCRDEKTRLWSVPEGSLLHLFGGTDSKNGIAFDPQDQDRVLFVGRRSLIRLMRMNVNQDPKLSVNFRSQCWALDFLADGERILLAGDSGAPIVTSHTGKLVQDLPGSSYMGAASTRNGRWVLLGGGTGTLAVHDLETNDVVMRTAHSNAIRAVRFSNDETLFATASFDGTARIWSTETWDVVAGPLQHNGYVEEVAFSPDDQRLATVGTDGALRLWSKAGEQLTKINYGSEALSVAFSPDGSKIVAGGRDGAIRVWDARTYEPSGAPMLHDGEWVEDVDFDSTGRFLFSCLNDGRVFSWHFPSRRQCGPSMSLIPGRTLYEIAISPKGDQLVAGGQGGKVLFCPIRLGTIGSDEEIATLLTAKTGMTIDRDGTFRYLSNSKWDQIKQEVDPSR